MSTKNIDIVHYPHYHAVVVNSTPAGTQENESYDEQA